MSNEHFNRDADDLTADQVAELRTLETATSPGQVDMAELDAETAELRKTWLALGRLLDAAGERFVVPPLGGFPPEGGTTNGFPPEGGTTIGRPPEGGTTNRKRRRVGIAIAITSALALSLVVAVAAFWMSRGGPQVVQEEGHGKVTQTPEVAPRIVQSPIKKPAAIRPGDRTAPQSAVADSGWNDPLDDEIVQVGRALVSARQEMLSHGDSAGAVGYEMNQIGAEMEKSPL